MTGSEAEDKEATEAGIQPEKSSSQDLTKNSGSSQEAKLPEILEKLLPDEVKQGMPTRTKREIELAFSLEGRRESSSLIDLTGKIESSHITQFLKNDAEQNERTFKDSQISKRYTLIYVLIFCTLFVFITIFLVDRNVSIYSDLLKIFVAFAGGFGSGLGYKSFRDRSNKS